METKSVDKSRLKASTSKPIKLELSTKKNYRNSIKIVKDDSFAEPKKTLFISYLICLLLKNAPEKLFKSIKSWVAKLITRNKPSFEILIFDRHILKASFISVEMFVMHTVRID